jgi:hypothetical protein
VWDLVDNGAAYAITNCNLAQKGANLKGLNLTGCDLSGANLSGANLSGANLQGDNLNNANLSGANLNNANLSGANLSSANLQGDNLNNANLSGASLRGANLSGANLNKANLSGANLSGANLSGANLNKANLSGAIFANLYNTNLLDALAITDQVTLSHNVSASLTDNVGITDQVTLSHNVSASLTDNVGITDQVTLSHNVSASLTDNVGVTDAASSAMPTIAMPTITKSLVSTPANNMSIQLSDSVALTDTTNQVPLGSIIIQTSSPNTLVYSTTYTITPNPKTGSGILTVTDGGLGDDDGINNGSILISNVPLGTYQINQISIPLGFSSLLGSVSVTVDTTHLDQTVVFQVISLGTSVTNLPPTPITSPALNTTTFEKWTSFSAKVVSNTGTTPVTNVDQTPQIILAGANNVTAINDAMNSQTSVVLDTSFAPLTSGYNIIKAIGLDNYTLPSSTDVVGIIPTITTPVNSSSGYIVATPPLLKIIPGQRMIIPVSSSTIPSFGGLKGIDVQSSFTSGSIGGGSDFFVAEIDDKIPSTISSSGLQGNTVLFLNLQYPFEDQGTGFNWANPTNFAKSPSLTIIVNKADPTLVQTDSLGCPLVVANTLASGSWTTSGVTETSSTSISSSQCQITMQSQHLSKFAFSLRHLNSVSTTQGLSGIGTVSLGISPSDSSNFASAIAPQNSFPQTNYAPSITPSVTTTPTPSIAPSVPITPSVTTTPTPSITPSVTTTPTPSIAHSVTTTPTPSTPSINTPSPNFIPQSNNHAPSTGIGSVFTPAMPATTRTPPPVSSSSQQPTNFLGEILSLIFSPVTSPTSSSNTSPTSLPTLSPPTPDTTPPATSTTPTTPSTKPTMHSTTVGPHHLGKSSNTILSNSDLISQINPTKLISQVESAPITLFHQVANLLEGFFHQL